MQYASVLCDSPSQIRCLFRRHPSIFCLSCQIQRRRQTPHSPFNRLRQITEGYLRIRNNRNATPVRIKMKRHGFITLRNINPKRSVLKEKLKLRLFYIDSFTNRIAPPRKNCQRKIDPFAIRKSSSLCLTIKRARKAFTHGPVKEIRSNNNLEKANHPFSQRRCKSNYSSPRFVFSLVKYRKVDSPSFMYRKTNALLSVRSFESGDDLLSRAVSSQVPSAC